MLTDLISMVSKSPVGVLRDAYWHVCKPLNTHAVRDFCILSNAIIATEGMQKHIVLNQFWQYHDGFSLFSREMLRLKTVCQLIIEVSALVIGTLRVYYLIH